MKKFKVQIVETYRRYVEIEANDEEEAHEIIANKINEGEIDLPCDGDDYEYDRELSVVNIQKA